MLPVRPWPHGRARARLRADDQCRPPSRHTHQLCSRPWSRGGIRHALPPRCAAAVPPGRSRPGTEVTRSPAAPPVRSAADGPLSGAAPPVGPGAVRATYTTSSAERLRRGSPHLAFDRATACQGPTRSGSFVSIRLVDCSARRVAGSRSGHPAWLSTLGHGPNARFRQPRPPLRPGRHPRTGFPSERRKETRSRSSETQLTSKVQVGPHCSRIGLPVRARRLAHPQGRPG